MAIAVCIDILQSALRVPTLTGGINAENIAFCCGLEMLRTQYYLLAPIAYCHIAAPYLIYRADGRLADRSQGSSTGGTPYIYTVRAQVVVERDCRSAGDGTERRRAVSIIIITHRTLSRERESDLRIKARINGIRRDYCLSRQILITLPRQGRYGKFVLLEIGG